MYFRSSFNKNGRKKSMKLTKFNLYYTTINYSDNFCVLYFEDRVVIRVLGMTSIVGDYR